MPMVSGEASFAAREERLDDLSEAFGSSAIAN